MKVGRFLMTQSDHYVIVSNSALARNTGRQLVRRGEKTVLSSKPSPTTPSPTCSTSSAAPATPTCSETPPSRPPRRCWPWARTTRTTPSWCWPCASSRNGRRPSSPSTTPATLRGSSWSAPTLVIAPTILGSELLAMAMTNEQLDGTDLVGKLFPARGKASWRRSTQVQNFQSAATASPTRSVWPAPRTITAFMPKVMPPSTTGLAR